MTRDLSRLPRRAVGLAVDFGDSPISCQCHQCKSVVSFRTER
jgi:hypothetical protein